VKVLVGAGESDNSESEEYNRSGRSEQRSAVLALMAIDIVSGALYEALEVVKKMKEISTFE
jgi:hypothetical protein